MEVFVSVWLVPRVDFARQDFGVCRATHLVGSPI